MRLKDLVQIDNRFEKSVNLLLDLNDKKKVNAYILTRSSINLLKDYLREVTGFSGRRANILIGPYGKGKSHLLLVLMAILSGKPSNELTMLFEKIKHIDIDAAETIEAINKSYRFLPVIINTTSGNLSQAFVRSLNYALIREGLDDIVPDNYFSEAIKAIKQWRDVYPDTFCAFKKSISCSAEDFIHYLEMYDYNAIADFRKIHPTITSGSEFNPIIDDEAISVYRSINRTLCEKYGYSGIYIIFDEFSKYIEGHTEEGFSADMKLLQDICELSNSSHKEQLHLTCVAHKAIRAYGDTLSKKVQNSFRGVEGRLVEIPFTVSSQNNYELISDAILKKDEFYNWEGNSSFKSILDESFQIPAFSALFKNDDFIKIVGEGCFPLTPFAALLLTQLSEKIAQNERTIFTFISGKDLNSLAVFVEKSEHVAYAGAGLIYDYFLPLFQGEKNTSIHNEWLKAEYALAKAGAPEEQSIIKSLSVIRMVNMAEDVPANDKYLRLASGMDTDVVSHALKSLIERSLITFKKKNAAYDFQNNIGVNVETEVADYALKYYLKVDVASVLNDVCQRPYILPKKYNQNHLMTRYYRRIYMNLDSFMALSSVDYLHDENEPDGYLIIICEGSNEIGDELQKHLGNLNENRIILGIPESISNIEENARSLLAVRKLLGNKEFIAENEVILTELQTMESDLIESLNEWMTETETSIARLFHCSKEIPIDNLGINRSISNICENTYKSTPLINHELINRHTLSPQISKARNALMDDILHGRLMEKYKTGTSAESTIYRALVIHTKNDVYLPLVKNEILTFIHECKGKKLAFSRLVNRLVDEPYGMRRGPIPIYIIEQLAALEDIPVVYFGNQEFPIDAQLMANIIRTPEEYFLFVEEETGQKLEYIEGLEKLFEDYNTYCRGIDSRNRLSRLSCMMQAWYRSLPQTSATFIKQDHEKQSIKEIDTFRKLLGKNFNPREVLFDRIPKLFKVQEFEEALVAVTTIKRETDQHIHYMKDNAIRAIRKGLSLGDNDDLSVGIQTWYADLSDNIKNSVFSADSQRIFGVIKNIGTAGAEEIVEKLAKAVTGFYVEDWNDNSIEIFEQGFKDLVNEIEEKNKNDIKDSANKVIIATDSGLQECLYDFDPDNLSPSGYFFQNALDEMVDEYGESIENNEKIGILMQMVKKLMG